MSLKFAMGLGFTGIVLVACGGGVSLGDGNQKLGGETTDAGTTAKDCTVKDACGPAPAGLAMQCSDGSIGGNTGRCLATAEGSCGWEYRTCPIDGGTTTGDLKWYTTCGDPICRPTNEDAGAPVACPEVGSACTTKGEACGNPSAECGVMHVCDDHDPKGGSGGGCPISTKKAKDDIAYVGDGELARLHDETMRMKLATYRYKGPFIDPNDPNAKHLGFIVEDQPQSLSVDRGHDRVDIYGYVSMAVATIQVQDKRLEAQQRQIELLQKQVDSLRARK